MHLLKSAGETCAMQASSLPTERSVIMQQTSGILIRLSLNKYLGEKMHRRDIFPVGVFLQTLFPGKKSQWIFYKKIADFIPNFLFHRV